MVTVIENSYSDSCLWVANEIKSLVQEKPDAKLVLPTGDTPKPVYKNLVDYYTSGELDFENIRTVNLDEYCGISPDHPQSYRYFMDTNLFKHVNIKTENTFVPSGTIDKTEAVAQFEGKIYDGGVPDLAFLGVGQNGHIAFNEPGDYLEPLAHIATLDASTVTANAHNFDNPSDVPIQAITMGMKGILSAKKVILLATGVKKADAIKELLLTNHITTKNPSTFLKLHSDAIIVIDKELADHIGLHN